MRGDPVDAVSYPISLGEIIFPHKQNNGTTFRFTAAAWLAILRAWPESRIEPREDGRG
jgi:hypothetical protein